MRRGITNYKLEPQDVEFVKRRRRRSLMVKLAAEPSHDDVQVCFQGAQVVEGCWIDFAQEAAVKVRRIHHLRTEREDSVGDGNVDVGGVFDDAGD